MEPTKSIHVIGFQWDEYTPQVEAQLTKDLIALNQAVTRWPGSIFKASAGLEAHRIIAALNIELALPEEARTWRTYQTTHDRVQVPDWAEDVIACDLSVKHSNSNVISRGPHNGYALKEFGRMDGYYPFKRRPPNTKWATSDPLVTMIWGG